MFFKKRKLFAAIKKKDIQEIKQLIAAKPSLINARDGNGNTPLHWAAGWCLEEIAIFLLNSGADVNAKAKRGGSPLHGAAGNGDGWIAMAQILLHYGANINEPDKRGLTPLDAARERPTITSTIKMERFLQDRGAKSSRDLNT